MRARCRGSKRRLCWSDCGSCLPRREGAARGLRAVWLKERGEMSARPGAKWTSFEAEEVIEAGRIAFCMGGGTWC